MKSVLLVEDEDPKLRHLLGQLKHEMPSAKIEVCRSVNSATDYLDHSMPDLVVLDMSLPTFDVTKTEGGGRPQGFGGVEVLRHIAFSELTCKVIVITGYEAFPKGDGQVNLEDLEAELTSEFSDTIAAVLRFNSVYDLWKVELHAALADLQNRGVI